MSLGRILIVSGIILVAAGVLVLIGSRLGLGQLPGDLVLRGERWSLHLPLVTSLVLSLLLTAIVWLIRRFIDGT